MPTLLDPLSNATNPVAEAAKRRRAEQDQIIAARQQQMEQSAAEAQRQATAEQQKQLGTTMRNDALQWTDKANPQLHVPWEGAPAYAKQHFIDPYANTKENPAEVWNSSFVQNGGVIPGLEHMAPTHATKAPDGGVAINYATKEPIPQALKIAAAHSGIAIAPEDDADSIQTKMAFKTQEAEQSKADAANTKQQALQDKTSITEWQKLVRQNPTAQTVARNLSTAERNLRSIEDNSKGEVTPAMQNNIVTAYMGIEKPGVSPTNEDRKAALNTAGLGSRLAMGAKNLLNNTGNILTPEQIVQMKEAARLTIDSYRREYIKHVSSAVQEALKRGLDPNTVIAPGVYDHATKRVNAPQDPNAVFGEGDSTPGEVQVVNESAQQPNITKEQYDALPSGSPYTWNGQQLKKK